MSSSEITKWVSAHLPLLLLVAKASWAELPLSQAQESTADLQSSVASQAALLI